MDDKVDLKSLDIKKDKIEQLKKAFPEVVTEGNVDFERLKIELGEEIETGKERYEMKWPGKADLQKIIQEPSIGTLKPVEQDSVDFDTTENLFIEGDSLEVLKLLQKSYYGKVKMIYIDPPYNTGKDFVYPDNYSESLDTYLRYTGQKGEEGLKLTTNAETEGRYHSKWMNMTYPRLFLARNLLKEDGVIFVSIDDHEVDNLKKICNEIFGEENFLAQLTWTNKEGGGSSDSKYFRIKHEYIIVYSKSINESTIGGVSINNLERYTLEDEYVETRGRYYLQKLGMGTIQYSQSLDYPLKTPDGTEVSPSDNNNGNRACWRWSKKKFEWGVENGFIVFKKDRSDVWQVYTKQYLNSDNNGKIIERTQRPFGVIDKYSSTQASKEVQELFGGQKYFEYPKPSGLIKYISGLISGNEDIVLDFFAGSATTAHAVLDLNKEDAGNRKFIMVQLQEPTAEDSEAFKAGYKNIAEIGKERIRRVIKKIKEENEVKLELDGKNMDLGFRVFRLDESNFKLWDKKSDAPLQQQLELTVDNINDKSSDEEILYEIILKSGFELSVLVEKVEIQGKAVYSVDNKSLLICLENDLTQDLMKEISEMEPARVVCLDRGFSNNDQLKTNTVELMKAKSVEFKTV